MNLIFQRILHTILFELNELFSHFIDTGEIQRQKTRQRIIEYKVRTEVSIIGKVKETIKYQFSALVAIKRIQFGSGLKLRQQTCGKWRVGRCIVHAIPAVWLIKRIMKPWATLVSTAGEVTRRTGKTYVNESESPQPDEHWGDRMQYRKGLTKVEPQNIECSKLEFKLTLLLVTSDYFNRLFSKRRTTTSAISRWTKWRNQSYVVVLDSLRDNPRNHRWQKSVGLIKNPWIMGFFLGFLGYWVDVVFG